MTSVAGVALDVVLTFRAVCPFSLRLDVVRLIRRIIKANDLTAGFFVSGINDDIHFIMSCIALALCFICHCFVDFVDFVVPL